MKNKIMVFIGVLTILIVAIYTYYHFSNSSNIIMNFGESNNWRIEAFMQNNKDIYIFRPTLYPKFYPDNSLELEVIWNLDEKLSIDHVNSPELTSIYSFSETQAKHLPDIPLQNFNFLNGNRKEILRLLSQSSIEIVWRQGDGEIQKETIKINYK
ncbi:hypothetical protein SAMN05661008_01827 [Alkalithermobacter thermoalcaliphilus JW-YL-7 = DSM 7308]|uniref:Uncharacterized protein n=1 Tax=Alkalithermobacter thermoalcaliphilus JW-YL-7 = DSM 7308 TaxID=1121328 RepID=A0A150FQU1_CLOPD|nr:hypothetical protein JWYL7_1056 [[Clostridium] paradoxum JW-YL-7 = DSM 7308]SHL29534.1 hypothetical protein SAMN05661008_01827 [[Clostridium] paradoxum JW-YL-7 = DSM 7308]